MLYPLFLCEKNIFEAQRLPAVEINPFTHSNLNSQMQTAFLYFNQFKYLLGKQSTNRKERMRSVISKKNLDSEIMCKDWHQL